MIKDLEGEEKKALMLLKSLILHYHGLDEDEENILQEAADNFAAHEELRWANEFIAEDYLSAFERSREYLHKIIGSKDDKKKLEFLLSVWEDNNRKGYLTEMEATAMINLAKDWKIERALLSQVNR